MHEMPGLPFVAVWVACITAIIFYSGGGAPSILPMILSLIALLTLVIWEAGTLQAMISGVPSFSFGPREGKFVMSNFLYGVILIFGATIILLPIILAALALMALVSFDPDAVKPTSEETAAAWEAFRSHPLFAICVAIFAAGIAAIAAMVMRGIAFAAASIAERRVIAMEAFHWTRGQSLRLLIAGFVVAFPFIVLNLGGSLAASHLQTMGRAAHLLGSFLAALTLWPGFLAALAVSAEVFERFRKSV